MLMLLLLLLLLLLLQVFEHEAMVRVLAGASPARSFLRHHHGSALRRRRRQQSATVRLTNTLPGTSLSVIVCSKVK